jgi:glucose-6-phosphate isomerase
MITTLDLTGIDAHLSRSEIQAAIFANQAPLSRLLAGKLGAPSDLGWLSPGRMAQPAQLDPLLEIAAQIRETGEVFVLIGVGGSNRGAQSVIQALGDRKVEILYAGDTLSSQALQHTLSRIRGRSVFLNAIAKDFNTLEPGIAFRLLRQELETQMGPAARERIIVTGSRGAGQLAAWGEAFGCRALPFPDDMGGRFSVLSPVGLLPMAVAGVDIRQLIQGASAASDDLQNIALGDNPACQYAAARNLLGQNGFVIENLVTFEPSLSRFARWWSQLFAESEGKNGQGIFPTASSFSEDLHALGQYIQDGKRILMETFLEAHFPNPGLVIPPDASGDGFSYLDHQPYDQLNAAVYQAALAAHSQAGVPCFQFRCSELTARTFGELFYLFMLSCAVSAIFLGVNPFGQPGVEAYKRQMAQTLGKPAQERAG